MKLASIPMVAALLLAFSTLASVAGDMKVEAQLIWASGDAKSPNPKHKPVDADVQHKLSTLPLKWSHFFEETRKTVDVTDATTKIELSHKSAVEIKHVQGNKLEITYIGNGAEVWKGIQPLPKNDILVIGGNAPGDSAWLVTLKRVE
jgi:hypothetical protein